MSIGSAVRTHHFTLRLSGKLASGRTADASARRMDEIQRRLLAAGCDDASLWSESVEARLEFSRQAECLGDAIGSAVKDVERAGFGVAREDVG